ncbi:MAG: phosphoglycerate mutase family protein [Flavobacteriaceae bacterium]|nr:histidine phosphatase family protein [Flavobacteriaceae bacterium]MDA7849315.1 histidine phosphatase family protein [Flavobacteriaceae bacterium]MDG1309799.1 phosphoglycerate mutase family protein [Flavobacteriaceae bacterium]
MKKYFIIISMILGFQSCVDAQKDSELFTIYLVRHSEKDLTSNNHSNPPLSQCGEQRSENLSNFLRDVNLDAIYSSDYIRTQNTALPTALSKGLEISEYNPQELEDFSKLLIANKQDVLVVGHSNTTGVLAGLLVGEEIGAFDLDVYDRVYQALMYKNSGRLQLLHTAFDCSD